MTLALCFGLLAMEFLCLCFVFRFVFRKAMTLLGLLVQVWNG
jgi:hypothetical protein